MLAPTPQELALLTRTERFAFRIGDRLAGPLKTLAALYNRLVGVALVGLCARRRVVVHGFEHVQSLRRTDRTIWVANHRSFFDFYVLFATLFRCTHVGRRVFFPVRSTFFYEGLAGVIVNLVFAGGAMFPPILRDRTRAAWNTFAMARCLAELEVPGTTIGIHPEGRRGTGPDPFELLPPKPGVGQLALESSAEVKIMPVFLHGLTDDLVAEVRKNLFRPRAHPVHLCFGPPVELARHPDGSDTAQRLEAAQACMVAVAALGQPLRAAPVAPAEAGE